MSGGAADHPPPSDAPLSARGVVRRPPATGGLGLGDQRLRGDARQAGHLGPDPSGRRPAPEPRPLEGVERLGLVSDEARPVRSTGNMPPWYTSKPCVPAARCHLTLCVCDSTWEAKAAGDLDRHPRVVAWAKNDHLGFEVPYLYRGAHRKYRPTSSSASSPGRRSSWR